MTSIEFGCKRVVIHLEEFEIDPRPTDTYTSTLNNHSPTFSLVTQSKRSGKFIPYFQIWERANDLHERVSKELSFLGHMPPTQSHINVRDKVGEVAV